MLAAPCMPLPSLELDCPLTPDHGHEVLDHLSIRYLRLVSHRVGIVELQAESRIICRSCHGAEWLLNLSHEQDRYF